MTTVPMNVNIRKIPQDKDHFEFTISTPSLRSQFIIPRPVLNELRIIIEKVLIDKQ